MSISSGLSTALVRGLSRSLVLSDVLSLLLDDYSGAVAAYSVRKLRNAQILCMRVRRSSDNTEQDIGFDGLDLDTTALTNFVGSGNGFLVVMYDQSGNGNDATQTTAASQPKIVNSGNAVTKNGKPALDFDGNDDALLNLNQIFSGTANATTFTVHETSETSFDSPIISIGDLNNGDGKSNMNSPEYGMRVGNGFKIFNTSANGTQSLFTAISSGPNITDLQGYLNGSELSVSNDKTQLIDYTGGICIAGQLDTLQGDNIRNYGDVRIQEAVIYNSDQSANRTDIENNINNYYTIY